VAAIKNVKLVYYLLLWMHLRILNQNLWLKRGAKNLTIRHTSYGPVTVVQEVTSGDGHRFPGAGIDTCTDMGVLA